MSCQKIIDNLLLSQWNDQNPELNYYMWNNVNCQGKQYPVEITETSPFNKTMNSKNTPFQNIKSFYIPPHATLSIRNKNKSTIEFTGPYTCEDTQTLLEYWSNGQVFSNMKFKDNVESFVVRTHSNWNNYLESLWRGNFNNLHATNSLTLPINFNHFYTNQCQENPNNFLCGCHKAYDSTQPNVDISQRPNTTCDPDIMHVPPNATVSFHTKESCKRYILQELESKRLNFEDVLSGQDVFTCGTSNISIPVKDLSTDNNNIVTDTNQSFAERNPNTKRLQHRPDLLTYMRNKLGKQRQVIHSSDSALWILIISPVIVFVAAAFIFLYFQH